MSDPQQLHRSAMSLADQAALCQREGGKEQAAPLWLAAFQAEAAAAELFARAPATEPTRSVLYRSAASLAVECGLLREAEQLVARALAGTPPAAIADELRDLYETVNFQRHLQLRGVTLEADEFQLSLEGAGVGFGIAPTAQFIGRVRDLETLIYRTAERKMKRSFREAGRRKKALDERLQLFVSVPRAASFAVTFRVGALNQAELPFDGSAADVVHEVLDCVDLLNGGKMTDLEARVGDEAYYRNFVGLVQKLAPDGELIRSVGFTATTTHGAERRVKLVIPRASVIIPKKPTTTAPEAENVEIRGVLLEADAKDAREGRIELRAADGTLQRIVVPRGLMADIVRPHFEEDVVIAGIRRGSVIELESIRPATD